MDEVPATHTPDDFEQFLARVPEHVRQERRLAATAKRRIRDIWGGSLDLLVALLHESRAMGEVSSKTVLPSLCSEGIDLLEIPGAFVVAGCQHASAAHGIPGRGVSGAVQASAHDGRRFEDRNIFARQAAVADHEGGGGQGSDAATDEIGL